MCTSSGQGQLYLYVFCYLLITSFPGGEKKCSIRVSGKAYVKYTKTTLVLFDVITTINSIQRLIIQALLSALVR